MAIPTPHPVLILALLAIGTRSLVAQDWEQEGPGGGWMSLSSSDEDQQRIRTYETEEYLNNWALQAINASRAYALLEKNGLPTGGRGVLAAVSDKGIDFGHPELEGSQGPSAVLHDYSDTHGTHIAGSIAARRDGRGMHGVAFDATVIALDQDRWDHFPAAARVHGARVINTSWSQARDEEDSAADVASALQQIVATVEADAVIVVSLSQGDETGAGYPASFAPEPAVAGRILTVVAVDREGRLDSHRCGATLAPFTLAAPGVDVLAPAASRREPHEVPVSLDGREYFRWPGTSMAVPQVVGAVAVLRAAWPSLSAAQVVQALTQTARRLGPSDQYGHGLIDLHAAVQHLGSGGVPPAPAGPRGLTLESEDGATGSADRTEEILRLRFGDEVHEYHRARDFESQDGAWVAYASEAEAILWPASNQGPYYVMHEGDEEWVPSGWSVR